MLPPLFKKIINFFNKFPEIGPRQAIRFFFWFLKQDQREKEEFLENLNSVSFVFFLLLKKFVLFVLILKD